MRKAAIMGPLVLLAAAGGAFAAAGGDAAPKPGLRTALARTAAVSSQRYAFTVRITKKDAMPLVLRVRGQQNADTISVHLNLSDMTMPDGTTVAASGSAALLLGPFLYEQAPSGVVLLGKARWLRLHVADLSPDSAALKAVHALTPAPLLRVIGEARMTQAGPDARLYRGTVAYDNPLVRSALARLTGGTEFRRLRISTYVGRDGLIHRLLLTGRTADRASTLSLSARLFAFGRPVHVKPPPPGTFIDDKLVQLSS
jgi:hypothetical protein